MRSALANGLKHKIFTVANNAFYDFDEEKNKITFNLSMYFCKYFACTSFAYCGCGKFQPINAPTII